MNITKKQIEEWFLRNRPNYELNLKGHITLISDCIEDLAPKWVSVDDDLPEIGQMVLIKIPVCGAFNIESATYKGDGMFIGAWCDSRGMGCSYDVSEWISIPK